nr:hypothetical protein Cbor_120 [Cedratvirus borely]WIL03368.1 hypothetical protein Cplu_115 [Cedratvirus plubellavi]
MALWGCQQLQEDKPSMNEKRNPDLMLVNYNKAREYYGKDPIALLREAESRYMHLCKKENITYSEMVGKQVDRDIIKILSKVVSGYEKKIN